MLRRILFSSGLVLLVFALVGIGLLPQSGLRRASRYLTVHLPDSLAPAPEPQPVIYGSPANAATNFIGDPPWLSIAGMCFSIFVVLGGTLLVAHLRTPRASQPGRDTGSSRGPLLAGGALVVGWLAMFGGVCLLGLCAVTGYLFFGQQLLTYPGQGVTAQELTNQFMMTQLPHTVTAVFGTQSAPTPTLSPNEMTNNFMQTALANTSTAAWQPTEYQTPTPHVTTTGQPEPASVAVDWPQQMDVTDTAWVRVDWSNREYSDTRGMPPTQPLLPFADPFGADYQGAVNVTLSGDGFEVKPDSQLTGPQPLDKTYFGWSWEIRPTAGPGPRRLDALVEGTWEPVGGQGLPIRRTLARIALITQVTQPAIPPDQLSVLTFVSGLLGLLLCVPWMYASFKSGRPA